MCYEISLKIPLFLSNFLYSAFIFIFILFQLGMASALETLCGQAFGAQKHYMLGVYLQRSWIILFLCCVLILPLFLYTSPILKFMGQPSIVADLTGVVAMWVIPLHFCLGFLFPLQRFLQCQLKTGVIAWVSLVVLVVHVIISWLFVYVFKLGVIGTAATLSFSWWLLGLGLLIYTLLVGALWLGMVSQLKHFQVSGSSLSSLLLLGSWFGILSSSPIHIFLLLIYIASSFNNLTAFQLINHELLLMNFPSSSSPFSFSLTAWRTGTTEYWYWSLEALIMQRLIWMLYPSGLQPYIAFDTIIGHSEHVHDAHLKCILLYFILFSQ